jgi:predicted O-methyltransferase YrrM
MNAPTWNPGTLLQLSGNYWQAFTLHAGVKMDLFTLLSETSMRAETVAEKTGSDVRGMSFLLNALAAMGLLKKKSETYRATPPAEAFLNRKSKDYIGYMILHHHYLAESWARMDEAVRTGKPLRHRAGSSDDQRREAFLMGMYNMASQQAPQIALAIDLNNRRKLLDVGGGPGTYAIHFCTQNKDLQAVVVDLPTTRPFAEKTIAQHGLSHRIAFVPGNYISEEIEGRYDVAWLSHILHAEGPDTCDRILRNVVRAMMPGAIILIHDFILNDNMDGPLFPALFALNMLQGTEQGQSYSQSQLRKMLQNAGVRDIERLDYVGPTQSGIMMGTVGT